MRLTNDGAFTYGRNEQRFIKQRPGGHFAAKYVQIVGLILEQNRTVICEEASTCLSVVDMDPVQTKSSRDFRAKTNGLGAL